MSKFVAAFKEFNLAINLSIYGCVFYVIGFMDGKKSDLGMLAMIGSTIIAWSIGTIIGYFICKMIDQLIAVYCRYRVRKMMNLVEKYIKGDKNDIFN